MSGGASGRECVLRCYYGHWFSAMTKKGILCCSILYSCDIDIYLGVPVDIVVSIDINVPHDKEEHLDPFKRVKSLTYVFNVIELVSIMIIFYLLN